MSRIQDYPEAMTMADDDILVIDGDTGTRKVKKSKFVEIISEHVDGEISEMRQDFQDGVDTIYNAIVAEGITPASSTPTDCAAGIAKMESDVYDAIVAKGVTPAADTIPGCVAAIPNVYTKGKTDAESVTWTENMQLYCRDDGSSMMFEMSLKDVISVTFNSFTYDAGGGSLSIYTTSQFGSQGDIPKGIIRRWTHIEGSPGTTITNFTSNEKVLSFLMSQRCLALFTITRQAKVLR